MGIEVERTFFKKIEVNDLYVVSVAVKKTEIFHSFWGKKDSSKLFIKFRFHVGQNFLKCYSSYTAVYMFLYILEQKCSKFSIWNKIST